MSECFNSSFSQVLCSLNQFQGLERRAEMTLIVRAFNQELQPLDEQTLKSVHEKVYYSCDNKSKSPKCKGEQHYTRAQPLRQRGYRARRDELVRLVCHFISGVFQDILSVTCRRPTVQQAVATTRGSCGLSTMTVVSNLTWTSHRPESDGRISSLQHFN